MRPSPLELRVLGKFAAAYPSGLSGRQLPRRLPREDKQAVRRALTRLQEQGLVNHYYKLRYENWYELKDIDAVRALLEPETTEGEVEDYVFVVPGVRSRLSPLALRLA
jgi:hypothetical protein